MTFDELRPGDCFYFDFDSPSPDTVYRKVRLVGLKAGEILNACQWVKTGTIFMLDTCVLAQVTPLPHYDQQPCQTS